MRAEFVTGQAGIEIAAPYFVRLAMTTNKNMKKIVRKTVVQILVFSFGVSNSAYPSSGVGGTLRAGASARTSSAGDIRLELFDDYGADNIAEGGFVFKKGSLKPSASASGIYGDLKAEPGRAADKDTAIYNSMLKETENRLLTEGGFDKSDFEVKVRVVYNAWKAAAYDRKRDTVYLDARCFGNKDFLRFKVEHELKDRKLPDTPIIGRQFKRYPALRELFTLITVDITGFMELRKKHPRRAEHMLEFCKETGNPFAGLLKLYIKIDKGGLGDPFMLTEDVFRLIESDKEKAYFPNTRKSARRLNVVYNKDSSIDYRATAVRLRPRLKSIYYKYLKLQEIHQEVEFKPLSGFEGRMPAALKPFKPYAGYVDYRYDENNCVFLRIKLGKDDGRQQYAYIYIGVQDKWQSVLGEKGKIYGLTYKRWQMKSPEVFQYAYDDAKNHKEIYRNRLAKLAVSELADTIYNDYRRDELLEMFQSLFDNIGIKNGFRSNWNYLRKIALRNINETRTAYKKALGRAPDKQMRAGEEAVKAGAIQAKYYAIKSIIDNHVNQTYPKFFFGDEHMDFLYKQVSDIPVWPVIKDPNIAPKFLSWLNPMNKQIPLRKLYDETEDYRMSQKDILAELKRQKQAFTQEQRRTQPQFSGRGTIYRENLPLFTSKPKILVSDIAREVEYAVYSAA